MSSEVPREKKLTTAAIAVLAFLKENGGAMVLLEMKKKMGLPRRTIYTAIRRLELLKLVQAKTPFWDTRQAVLFIDSEEAHAQAKVLLANRPPTT